MTPPPLLAVCSAEGPVAYAPVRCAECGRVIRPFARVDDWPHYCGELCAKEAQPDKVVTGAGGEG